MISTIIVSDSASNVLLTTGGFFGSTLGRRWVRNSRAIATRTLARATKKARRHAPSSASMAELPEASSEAVGLVGPSLAIRPVALDHLDHLDAMAPEESSKPGPIGAGSFHADPSHFAKIP